MGKEKAKNEEEQDNLSKELSTKEREYEQMKGHKFMKRDEFKNYAASLRDKSAKFKKLKVELSDLRGEVAVLLRTEQILQAKDPTPPGMRETEAMLEKASVNKSEVDKAKGKTLDEISAIVKRIESQLKEKKNKLAPQIKALRSVRQNFQTVESHYIQKKNNYDQAKSSIDAEVSRVSSEVKRLEGEVQDAAQQYHELNMQLNVCESQLQRSQREQLCVRKEESCSKDFQTLGELYTDKLLKLDESCREFRKQQKHVKETHESNLKQKKMFTQVEQLLMVKLKVANQEMQNCMDGRFARSVMDASMAGVERLVIE